MYDRLKETDYDIIEVLQKFPQGLSFADLVNEIGKEPVEISERIKKLIKKNFITKQKSINIAFFLISEENKHIKPRRVRCPICFSSRRIHRHDQNQTYCPNRNCKTPRGTQRNFWVLNIDHMIKGKIKHINLA